MVSITDAKRTAIAQKLADMKAIQNLIISNEEILLQECEDNEVRKRLQDFIEDDKKNLGIIDTVTTQYGIQAEPKDTVIELIEKTKQMMGSDKLTTYEKVTQHELLKHGQFMSGIVVHKAAQIVGADIEAAIAPLNTVNFENRAHQEQLKSAIEFYGVRELTGQEPDQGFWGRVQDAVAAVTGVVGSAVTQSSDKSDMNVQDVIRMDHQKVNVLFAEIEGTDDPQKMQEYFGQLYMDLSVHSEAEEQVVYPNVRSFYGDDNTQELYDEQAEFKVLLSELKSLNPTAPDFKAKLEQLKNGVMDHVRQEESTMFAAIRNNCSTEQQEQMATQFKEAKKQLQTQMSKETANA
ncbi:MAG: hemerythrin domain-containing protein [Xenococcaceae cyanobacterium]